jgi:hypothetical protein
LIVMVVLIRSGGGCFLHDGVPGTSAFNPLD